MSEGGSEGGESGSGISKRVHDKYKCYIVISLFFVHLNFG